MFEFLFLVVNVLFTLFMGCIWSGRTVMNVFIRMLFFVLSAASMFILSRNMIFLSLVS